MRASWGDLERPGRAGSSGDDRERTFRSKVVGPHFETLCREWARWHAAPETHGGHPSRVAAGVVNEPSARTGHEVDVVVFGRDDHDREVTLAIGEAKWNETIGREATCSACRASVISSSPEVLRLPTKSAFSASVARVSPTNCLI